MLRFQEPLLLEGLWWLPETPEDQVSGSFVYDQDQGGNLTLSGMLRPLETSMNSDVDARHTIYGFTKKGQFVTLLDCFSKSRSLSFPGIGSETYHVHVAAIGLHFLRDDEAIFSKSYFRFDGIEKWLGEKPLDVSMDFEERRLSVTTRSSKEQPFANLSDQDLRIGLDLRTKPAGDTEVAVLLKLTSSRSRARRSL